jgi:hypothetical protein
MQRLFNFADDTDSLRHVWSCVLQEGHAALCVLQKASPQAEKSVMRDGYE